MRRIWRCSAAMGFILAAACGADELPERVLAPGADQLGLYSVLHNYFALETGQGVGNGADDHGQLFTFQHGQSNSAWYWTLPVAGDFNGDGTDTVGRYDTRTGRFALAERNTYDAARIELTALAEGIPVAGDFDGDGVDTVGVFDPVAGEFRIEMSLEPGGSGDPGANPLVFSFGPAGGSAVAGDFDGDGIDTVAVFDPATRLVHLTNALAPGEADEVYELRFPGSFAVAGDFDGSGRDSIGLYDPETNQLYLRYSTTAGGPDAIVALSPHDWRWRPLVGTWEIPDESDAAAPSAFDWPTGQPGQHGIDAASLDRAYDRAAATQDLHSLLVVRNGVLVGEAYYRGFDQSTAGNIKSVSKSVLSALFGIALAEGHITSTDQPASELLPEAFAVLDDPDKSAITVDHFITMTSGLDWTDNDIGDFVRSSHWVDNVLERDMVAAPGQQFNYSTGLTHVASALLANATGASTREFAQEHLFEPLGISAARWDRDPQGVFFGGAEMFMTPRDMARFGYLYLQGGAVESSPGSEQETEQIIPADWVSDTTSRRITVTDEYDYGGWWWRRQLGGHQTNFAWGWGGQFIFVFPTLDAIVVATSKWHVDLADAQAQYERVFALMNDYVVPSIIE